MTYRKLTQANQISNLDGTADLAKNSEYQPHLRHGRSRAAFIGVLWSSLHTFLPTLSAAIVFFISAYFLSPSDFGLVGLTAGIVSIAIAFSPLAFGEALVQRQEITKSHADSVFWLTAGFGMVLFAIFVVSASYIANFVGQPEIAFLLPVLALKVPLELMAAVPNSMIVRSMRFKLIALRTSVATIVSGVISVAMLMAGYGYWALVISQVSASLVICVMAFWVTGWRPGRSFSVAGIRDLARYGVFASGDRMLSTLKIDHILLGALAGPNFLGLYYFAQRLYGLLTGLVSGALSSVTHALLSTLQDDKEKTRQAFLMASFASASFSMPMFAGLALVVDDLLPLILAPKWIPATYAIKAFCLNGIFVCVGIVQAALIKSQGRVNWWFYYQLAQIVSTVAVILATYRFGMTTMMTVLVIKFVILWPVSAIMTARLLGESLGQYLIHFKNPLIATSVMSLAVVASPALFPTLDLKIMIPLQILTGVIVFGSTLLAISRKRIGSILHILKSKGKVSV